MDVPKSLLAVIETDWSKLNGEPAEPWLLVNENGTVTTNWPPKVDDCPLANQACAFGSMFNETMPFARLVSDCPEN